MSKNRTGNFLELFGSVGSVFRSVRSILRPRVVVDRSVDPVIDESVFRPIQIEQAIDHLIDRLIK